MSVFVFFSDSLLVFVRPVAFRCAALLRLIRLHCTALYCAALSNTPWTPLRQRVPVRRHSRWHRRTHRRPPPLPLPLPLCPPLPVTQPNGSTSTNQPPLRLLLPLSPSTFFPFVRVRGPARRCADCGRRVASAQPRSSGGPRWTDGPPRPTASPSRPCLENSRRTVRRRRWRL